MPKYGPIQVYFLNKIQAVNVKLTKRNDRINEQEFEDKLTQNI